MLKIILLAKQYKILRYEDVSMKFKKTQHLLGALAQLTFNSCIFQYRCLTHQSNTFPDLSI